MSKTIDLLPCPFCGASNRDLRIKPNYICCQKCGTTGPFEKGATLWNQRWEKGVESNA